LKSAGLSSAKVGEQTGGLQKNGTATHPKTVAGSVAETALDLDTLESR
jgi:hypothetical protein